MKNRQFIPPHHLQWFNENKKNWKTMAGLYYKNRRNPQALEVFKEALIFCANNHKGGDIKLGGPNDTHNPGRGCTVHFACVLDGTDIMVWRV